MAARWRDSSDWRRFSGARAAISECVDDEHQPPGFDVDLHDVERQIGKPLPVQCGLPHQEGIAEYRLPLRAAGMANQAKLVGQPVTGPIFEFAPAIGAYLQSHLFGAIFERDNFDWQSRELATVGMLSALPGVEAQLQSHMRMSINTDLTARQMQGDVEVLQARVGAESGRRAREALERALAPAQH